MSNKSINKFLQSLDEADFLYVNHVTSIALRWKNIINDLKITKEEFCEAMKIKTRDYNKFLSGADYSLLQIASFEALHSRKLLRIRDEEIEKQTQTMRFPKYKDSEIMVGEKVK